MKRFLLLFCTVVLVCSIMVVPAFGASVYHSEIVDGIGYVTLPPDIYYVELTINGVTYTSDVIDDFANGHSDAIFDFVDGNYSLDIEVAYEPGTYEGPIYTGLYYLDSGKDVEQTTYTLTFVPASTDPEPVTGGSPLSGVFGVFGGVGSWIIAQLGSLTSIFWNADAGALTFLGVLAVAALALAVILLLVFVVVRFLRFRG